ncbi:molybdopterin-dependent oxidoreductase [Pelagibacterium xiamenense]|uniref:molybdopterin-dependent oxidoreductase n=1 Tax=Pelagibacterium xiamenense TaxID=2901140 RepID=UPI001E374404|nr:molybdopterin-dependent oxidoreductase [Pelagibacterium xiamenense]MCD7060627.1 molybdopterin-dependent oxidoreductase [Pelagibacterium xiamenense]
MTKAASPLCVASLIALSLLAAPAAAQSDVPMLVMESSETAAPVIFSRDDLERMGLVTMRTHTPWNEGEVTFEGVPLETILQEADIGGSTATVTALNDYSVDIPVTDFTEYGVILAIKRNGEYMPVSDQGPFFVMYPFDSDPELQGQPYHGRAVWQVKEIYVE